MITYLLSELVLAVPWWQGSDRPDRLYWIPCLYLATDLLLETARAVGRHAESEALSAELHWAGGLALPLAALPGVPR